MARPRYLFLTGKLAETGLRRQLEGLGPQIGFDFHIVVLPIQVVALATTPWIARHFAPPPEIDKIILPGLCLGEMDALAPVCHSVPVERGPKDFRDLPEYFGGRSDRRRGYGGFDIEILAEINRAPRLSPSQIETLAKNYQADGADVIDLGCDPGFTWPGVGETVKRLRDLGLRVSIDSFDPTEVADAVRAGADLVLSVNGTNRERARDWGCEVVAIPDVPSDLASLDATVDFLAKHQVPFRLDPILEPIGFGFAASLGRYLEVRRRYPDAEMMMGIGNLTELTDADSAGVNVLLLGFCQEQGIRSVLTTEVINWARSSVREIDLARRLVFHACREKMPPKYLESELVLLRDSKLKTHGRAALEELASKVRDRNFRLFAEEGWLHAINGQMHVEGTDPFAMFREMLSKEAIDAAHAFYLGYEMAKAVTALTLGKNYIQDQALDWGFLTRPEETHQAPG